MNRIRRAFWVMLSSCFLDWSHAPAPNRRQLLSLLLRLNIWWSCMPPKKLFGSNYSVKLSSCLFLNHSNSYLIATVGWASMTKSNVVLNILISGTISSATTSVMAPSLFTGYLPKTWQQMYSPKPYLTCFTSVIAERSVCLSSQSQIK